MPSVFINYRTKDAFEAAVLVERDLSARFGSDEIFRAEKSIPAGKKWEDHIRASLRRCKVLVAMIGSHWLASFEDGDGPARDLRKDWVHREIATALTERLTVIPVYVDGARRFEAADLPKSIADLACCQGVHLTIRRPDDGLRRITEAVGRELSAAAAPRTGSGRSEPTARPTRAVAGNHFYGRTEVGRDVVAGNVVYGSTDEADGHDE